MFSYKTDNTAKEAHLPSTVSLSICFSIMENFYCALNIQIEMINCDQIAIDCQGVKQLHVTIFQPFYNFIRKISSVTKFRKNQ